MTTDKEQAEIYERFGRENNLGMDPEDVMQFVDDLILIRKKHSRMEKVKNFMQLFNQEINPEFPDDPKYKQKLFNLRVSLLFEEVKELAEALGANTVNHFELLLQGAIAEIIQKQKKNVYKDEPNPKEALDAIQDTEYVLLGTALSFGFGDLFDSAFDDVHESNMTKACASEEEAIATQDFYKNQAEPIETVLQYNDVFKVWLVMRASDKKVLKSINYKPVNLSEYVKN